MNLIIVTHEQIKNIYVYIYVSISLCIADHNTWEDEKQCIFQTTYCRLSLCTRIFLREYAREIDALSARDTPKALRRMRVREIGG